MAIGLLNGTLEPLSGDGVIDAMTNGYKWQLGLDRNIDWSISNGWRGEYWNNPTEVVAKFSLALSVMSYYANINFTYTGYFFDPLDANLSGSDINLALDSGYIFGPATNTWARAFFPNPNDVDRGDIYLNINSLANSISYEPGTAGWFLLLHEIGHTLGLKHPHDDGGTGRPTFSQLGFSGLDNDFLTMMSYEDDYNFNLAAYDPATPMILDVLALQYLYGKNMLTNAGDSRFILTNTNYYETLWDASGSDVIDQSGASEGWYIVLPNSYVSSLVDTKAGFAMPMSSVNLPSPTSLYWLAGDFENVIGSAYSDQIYLSSMNNVVNGGLGTDYAYFNDNRSECTITFSSGNCIVGSRTEGTDTLTNIEYLVFNGVTVAVSSLISDTTGPAFTSATTSADGFKVILSYNEPLHATTAAKTAFAVKVGSVTATVSSVAVSGSTIELTLATSIGEGQVVTVGYKAPTASAATTNAAVQDAGGNDAVTLVATTTVTNISTADKTGPTFTSATTSADGLKVILSYNEPLHATTAAKTAFAVKVGSVTATVSSVAVNGANIELTLATSIGAGQAVTVGYKAPTASAATTNAAVQDAGGNDAVTLVATTTVTNISTADKVAPTVSTFSPTDGLTGVAAVSNIVLTFSEAIAPGTGTITLRSGSATGTVVESFDAVTSSRLTISGSTLTIVPTNHLSAGTQYFVVFTSGNIKDIAGNAYAGISTYDFKTANIVNGTANNDTLTGTVNADTINGLAGNDTLTGGAGTDSTDGGEGSDLYIVAASADHSAAEFADTGASGTDEVRFTSTTARSTLTLYAGDTGIEKVAIGTGTAAEAVTTATTALNVDASALSYGITLAGNNGANVLTGGSGNDKLTGGGGNDTLTGGNGADWFIFDKAPNATSNKDTITDFTSGTDKLQFSKAIFTGLSAAALGDLSSNAFWSGAGVTTAHDADDRFIYNTTDGYLYYDADGNASGSAAVLVATLGATTTLAFTDLQIIV